jgi:hypothetical protein
VQRKGNEQLLVQQQQQQQQQQQRTGAVIMKRIAVHTHCFDVLRAQDKKLIQIISIFNQYLIRSSLV